MQSARANKLDFDLWADVARTDPARFEVMRSEAIERLIQMSTTSERRLQLQRVQWRIDRVRERSSNPMAACIDISRMMWDSFNELRGQYQEMFSTLDGPSVPRKKVDSQVRTAKVLPFRKQVAELEA